MRAIILDVQSSDVALETALVLLGQISRDAALQLVLDRAADVDRYERRMKRVYGGDGRESGGAGAFTRLRIVHRLAGERRYLNEIAGLLRDGELGAALGQRRRPGYPTLPARFEIGLHGALYAT